MKLFNKFYASSPFGIYGGGGSGGGTGTAGTSGKVVLEGSCVKPLGRRPGSPPMSSSGVR